jgi:hypothetical protein
MDVRSALVAERRSVCISEVVLMLAGILLLYATSSFASP